MRVEAAIGPRITIELKHEVADGLHKVALPPGAVGRHVRRLRALVGVEQRDAFGDDAADKVKRKQASNNGMICCEVHGTVRPAHDHLNGDEQHGRPAHGEDVAVACARQHVRSRWAGSAAHDHALPVEVMVATEKYKNTLKS